MPSTLEMDITLATHFNNMEKLESLLSQPLDKVNMDMIFRHACTQGHIDAVKTLLKYYNPKDNTGFVFACRKGYSEIVKLLLADPRTDPTMAYNLGIIFAAQEGHSDIVEMLLTDPRINPANDFDTMYVEPGKIKLEVSAVAADAIAADDSTDAIAADDSPRGNSALILACAAGHLDTVELLMNDDRVEPHAQHQMALLFAVEGKHIAIIDYLLSDSRVKPTFLILLTAVCDASELIVQKLLDSRNWSKNERSLMARITKLIREGTWTTHQTNQAKMFPTLVSVKKMLQSD